MTDKLSFLSTTDW